MDAAATDKEFLRPTSFVDSDDVHVQDFARGAVAGVTGERACAIALYNAVRDGIAYDPYVDYSDPGVFRASAVLAARRGFCVGKSALLAACARVAGIPARPGFADVRNHLTSRRLAALVKGDIFLWHSYTELLVSGRWVKCTPAFDRALCERAALPPLEFDGVNDSLFHPFDSAGRRHMEYLRDRGAFADVPHEAIMADFRLHYPGLIENGQAGGNFRAEVGA
jgi:transglutaminase-like putative cysteine protease